MIFLSNTKRHSDLLDSGSPGFDLFFRIFVFVILFVAFVTNIANLNPKHISVATLLLIGFLLITIRNLIKGKNTILSLSGVVCSLVGFILTFV